MSPKKGKVRLTRYQWNTTFRQIKAYLLNYPARLTGLSPNLTRSETAVVREDMSAFLTMLSEPSSYDEDDSYVPVDERKPPDEPEAA